LEIDRLIRWSLAHGRSSPQRQTAATLAPQSDRTVGRMVVGANLGEFTAVGGDGTRRDITDVSPVWGGTVMIQALRRSMTFEEFLDWYPEDGRRYELIDGEVVEVRPRGDHEEIVSILIRKLDREIERLGLSWFMPKTCCIKPEGNLDGYVPDLIVLDRDELQSEALWKKASTIVRGKSARLVVEVASTNWQDDYAKKLEDYELLQIPEYWIVDYRALGGRRFIGVPKRPTLSVYRLVDGIYQLQQFHEGEAIVSTVFPELILQAEEVLVVAE
jgi:Uma2 family endonuclease